MNEKIKMSCGHYEVHGLFGKAKEKENKIKWLEREGLCESCYKKMKEEAAARKKAARLTKKIKWNKRRIMIRAWSIKKREEITFSTSLKKSWDIEKKLERRDLNLHAVVDAGIEDGEIIVHLYIDGQDTREFKEEIKALGYHWLENLNKLGNRDYLPRDWCKSVPLENFRDEVRKAKEIGAGLVERIKDVLNSDSAYAAHRAKEEYDKQKEEEERQAKIIEKKINAIEKPVCPNKLVGRKWNGRIYGKKGSFNVYLDNRRTDISEKEKEEFEKYIEEKEKYDEKVEEIKNSEIC